MTGQVCVAYAFKFALDAEMNQGCIPSLFCVMSIYVGVIFYFAFNERISGTKILGILMMIPCVLFLSLDKKIVDEGSDSEFTAEQMRTYGLIAILFGVSAPLFWTYKSYWTRKAIE